MSEKKSKEIELIGQVVLCALSHEKTAVNVEECKKCPHHRGIEVLSTPDGMLPQRDVLCGMPTNKRLVHLSKGVVDASSK